MRLSISSITNADVGGGLRAMSRRRLFSRATWLWCAALAVTPAGSAAVGRPAPSPMDHWRRHVLNVYGEYAQGLDASVDPAALADGVCAGLHDGVSAEQVDELMAETAAYQASLHPDFARLAARVAIARLHACTEPGLLRTLRKLRAHTTASGEPAPLVSAELLEHAESMAPALEAALRHERDFDLDYFALRTLQRAYLRRAADGTPIERPQHMLMRVALCVHGSDVAAVLRSYELMAAGMFTHATPTLFNAGADRQQLCSCFLLTEKADSIDGIFDTLRQCALISRDAGGIGLSVSHIRASQEG